MSAKNPVQGETDKAWHPEKDTIKNKTKFQRWWKKSLLKNSKYKGQKPHLESQ